MSMNIITRGERSDSGRFPHRMREFRTSLVKNYTRKTEASPVGTRQVRRVNLRV